MSVQYLTKIPGILRILQMIFNFIGFICVVAIGLSARGDAFLVATIGGFIINIIIILMHILGLSTKIGISMNKAEFVYNVLWAVFLLITSALVIDVRIAGYIAGGTFGLFSTIAYLIDAFDKYSAGLV